MKAVDGVEYSRKMARSQDSIEKESGNCRRQWVFLCVISVSACLVRWILSVIFPVVLRIGLPQTLILLLQPLKC